jgi:hypothetical protein
MINHLVDVALFEDRIVLHGAEGAVEAPLAYQIHSKLIQTGELARLIAEHLRDDHGIELPGAGTRIRLRLPPVWGLVCLRLPYTGIESLRHPIHHVAWELDCNAPEQSEQYLFDFQEVAGDDQVQAVAGETRLLAVRHNLVQFCRTMADELGWILVELAPLGDEPVVFRLDLERARNLQERLAAERFEPVTPWRGLAPVLAGILLLTVAAGWMIMRRGSSSRDEAPVVAALSQAPAESLHVQPLQPAVADTLPASLEPAPTSDTGTWVGLLRELAAHETELPDFMVLDAGGMLVRVEHPPGRRLTEVLGRPSRVSRVGPTTYFLEFSEVLPGGMAGEDATRPVRRFAVASLAELAGQLDPPPVRLTLQRRRAEQPGKGTAWRFSPDHPRGAALGWQVTLLPGKAGRP